MLAPVPPASRHLQFDLADGCSQETCREVLRALMRRADGERLVVGFGLPLATHLACTLPGLHAFPAYTGHGVTLPATPSALWCWLRGEDRGELLHRARDMRHLLAPALLCTHDLETFRYENGRDLSGYEDGTENPEGAAAETAACAADGSSIAALQQWVHDLDAFAALSAQQQDHTIGRRKSDNAELQEAPENAHVKRTAQEDFQPEAFILRRSMPWADCAQAGLAFLAFGRDARAFEAILQRMSGQEDGLVDALFRFTHPVSGSYFWCPPMHADHPDGQALGL